MPAPAYVNLPSSKLKSVIRTFMVLGAVATTACGPSHQSAVAGIAAHNEALRERASFDMRCPKDSLRIVPLKQYHNPFHDDLVYAVMAGVTGCDRQATYVYDDYRGLWVLNADTQPEKK